MNQVGVRALETEGREYVKAEKELRFSVLAPNYGSCQSGQEEECCQVDKGRDLVWASSGRVQNSGASMDCFYAPGAMQNMDFSIDID